MGESFDHRPAGWIRESRKRCIQFIHNRMVVDYPQMSSVDFGVPDFCSGSLNSDACANSGIRSLWLAGSVSDCLRLTATRESTSLINAVTAEVDLSLGTLPITGLPRS